MSTVNDPPGAGKAGALRPASEDPSKPQAGTDPYAGLSTIQLRSRLYKKEDEVQRQALIREIEGRAPRKETPHPFASLSDRAKRLRDDQKRASETGRDDRMRAHADALDTLFEDMLFHSATGQGFDEKFGLMIALRAQKQALATAMAMERLHDLETRRQDLADRLKRKQADRANTYGMDMPGIDIPFPDSKK